MSEDLWHVIARLRRAQPRNPDTMAVCDALEEVLRYWRAVDGKPRMAKGTFDKKAYMRLYMRKWRTRQKWRRAEEKAKRQAD